MTDSSNNHRQQDSLVEEDDPQRAGEMGFVDDMGFYLESLGAPRMSGRILGWMLICDPPEQSSTQIAEALEASKGSISTGTRLLIDLGLLERTTAKGSRSTYFRIGRDAWSSLLQRRLGQFIVMRKMGEGALATIGNDDNPRTDRLWEMINFYHFIEAEFASAIEQYRVRRTDKGPR